MRPISAITVEVRRSWLTEPLPLAIAILPPIPPSTLTRNDQKAIFPRTESGWRANRPVRFSSTYIVVSVSFFVSILMADSFYFPIHFYSTRIFDPTPTTLPEEGAQALPIREN